MNIEERTRVEETLRQIDDLVAALGHIADPAAREAARKLVEAVLDLHGLALARIMTIVAAEGGRAVSEKLAADEQVKAVLLLYGLHPEDAATRVRRAVEAIRPRLTAAGIGIVLGRVSAGAVTVRVFRQRHLRLAAPRDRRGDRRCGPRSRRDRARVVGRHGCPGAGRARRVNRH